MIEYSFTSTGNGEQPLQDFLAKVENVEQFPFYVLTSAQLFGTPNVRCTMRLYSKSHQYNRMLDLLKTLRVNVRHGKTVSLLPKEHIINVS